MPKSSITEKKASLKAQIAQLEAQEKAEQEAINAVIGKVVFNAMATDANLKTRITALLEKNVKKNGDRALLGLEKLATRKRSTTTESV